MFERFRSSDRGTYYGRLPERPEQPYAFLNAAAMPRMNNAARERAREVATDWEKGTLSHASKEQILAEARATFARLIRLPSPEGVIICLNTTEALSLVRWISRIMRVPKIDRFALTTDAEPPATYRMLEYFRPEGNPRGRDHQTTYSEFFPTHRPAPPTIEERPTHIQTIKVPVRQASDGRIIDGIQRAMIEYRPKVLIFSLVLRSWGRILPGKEIVEAVRAIDPNIVICIDIAQALGNLPEIDFQSLGADIVVSSAHKTLETGTIGLAGFDQNNERLRPQIEHWQQLTLSPELQLIYGGMFHPSIGIKKNTDRDLSFPDIATLPVAEESFRERGLLTGENNFSVLHTERMEMRNRCRRLMSDVRRDTDVPIFEVMGPSPEEQTQSSFIQSFRIGHRKPTRWPAGYRELLMPNFTHALGLERPCRGRRIAIELGKRRIAATYLGFPDDVLRLAYNASTTEKEIEYFAESLREILRRNN